MIKKVLTHPDEKLRQKSDEIISFDSVLKKIVGDLIDTLEAQTNPPGLGISAPQIGVFKRVFVARIRNRIKSFVNPQIIKFSKNEVAIIEGCLSVPNLYGHVTRPAEVDVEAQDVLGKKFKNHYKGLAARIIQHEIDHLNGILFIDHIHDQNGKLFKVEKDKKGQEQFVEIAFA
jgi:peptide deformylase